AGRDPRVAEWAVGRGDEPVAWRQRIHERRLPPAGAGRREEERLPCRRLEHVPKIAQQSGGELRERGGAVVLHGAIHGPEDPLGHVGRAGDEQEIAAGHTRSSTRGTNTASGLRYS